MDTLDELASRLGSAGVQASSLFGKPALKDVGGKAFACLHQDALACRLGEGTRAHREALELDGAHLFDPSGKGRPMRDWVSVPATHEDRWAEFAATALCVPR
ncbi:hypothetical protein [Actinosynnema sp. NPDC020468]|uniref:hypothetical protein n=1 Tax=Actinosynnema sp. NPDC020468 TaxID=3154488 RepID=UPI0033E07A04